MASRGGSSSSSAMGVAGQGPGLGERLLDVRHRRPHHLDPGVAPGLDAALGIADPALTHAEPGDEGHPPVHRDHLAVVAGEPAEGAIEARRVEAAHLDAGLSERAPEPPGRVPERAEPVVDEPHAHAGPGPRRQEIGEPPPRLVLVDDVALEMDGAPGRLDRLGPRRIVLGGVAQDADAIAADQRGPRHSRERLVGEEAPRRCGGAPERARALRHCSPRPGVRGRRPHRAMAVQIASAKQAAVRSTVAAATSRSAPGSRPRSSCPRARPAR